MTLLMRQSISLCRSVMPVSFYNPAPSFEGPIKFPVIFPVSRESLVSMFGERYKMVVKLSDDDYSTLEDYIQAVLRRLRDGECTLSDACADIMQPLTAWDLGDKQEFALYMEMMMAKWQACRDDDGL